MAVMAAILLMSEKIRVAMGPERWFWLCFCCGLICGLAVSVIVYVCVAPTASTAAPP